MIKLKTVLRFPVESRVRQGDVLSPLLFNTILNDVIPLLQKEIYDIYDIVASEASVRPWAVV